MQWHCVWYIQTELRKLHLDRRWSSYTAFCYELQAVSFKNGLPKIFDDILKTLSKAICHLLNLKVILIFGTSPHSWISSYIPHQSPKVISFLLWCIFRPIFELLMSAVPLKKKESEIKKITTIQRRFSSGMAKYSKCWRASQKRRGYFPWSKHDIIFPLGPLKNVLPACCSSQRETPL